MQNLNSDKLRRQLDENNAAMNTLAEDNQEIVELLSQRGMQAINYSSDLAEIRLLLERRAETAKPEAGEEVVDQAQDEINKLRAENEKLRLQLSACGVAAMANTVDCAEKMRCISPDLKSGSWEAVCEAVNREMYYRDHRDALLEANLVAYPALQVNLKQLKEQRDLLLDALTPHVLEWVRCGLAANGHLQDGDHPALANLRAAIASCKAVQND